MDHQRRADLMLLLATSFWGISNCLTAKGLEICASMPASRLCCTYITQCIDKTMVLLSIYTVKIKMGVTFYLPDGREYATI